MAVQQVNQRLSEIAYVRTHPNAQQPRSQLLGGDNLLQLGLQLEQFSAERHDARFDQGCDLYGDLTTNGSDTVPTQPILRLP